MALSDQMATVQSLVNSAISALAAGNTKSAKLSLSQLRLLIATMPAEYRDEFAQLKMHDAGSVNEILTSLEEQIVDMELGGTGAIERIPIDLGPHSDDESCIW